LLVLVLPELVVEASSFLPAAGVETWVNLQVLKQAEAS
jgi:hypothetical protein